MGRVNVENEYGDIIARVQYNHNLDYWDGRNWVNGGMGSHKGLTKLKDGRYVIIHGSDWQGDSSTAEIVSAEQALQEILRSGNDKLLSSEKFKQLQELHKTLHIDDLEEDENNVS
ncbi:MAG: hypothetical protein AB7G87_03715 [Clostridia bacterium]